MFRGLKSENNGTMALYDVRFVQLLYYRNGKVAKFPDVKEPKNYKQYKNTTIVTYAAI